MVFDLIDCSCQDRSIGVTWPLLLRFCRIMGYVAIAYYYITISCSLQGQHNILPSYGSASNSLTHKCQVLISSSIALENLLWSLLMLWCSPSEILQLFCGHYLCLYWSVYLLLYLFCFRPFCSVLLPATAPVRPCSKTVGFRRRPESHQAGTH